MSQHIINNWVANWVSGCAKHAKAVCLVFLVLCALLANYTSRNLGINTKTTDMLSETLAWRQNLLAHEAHFPHLTDTLVAVIDAQTPMLALDARDQLAVALQQQDELFYDVYLPGGGDFFRQHGLLFLELEELDQLIEQLAQIQPFLGRLERGEGLSGYFQLLEQSLQNLNKPDQAAVVSLLSRTAEAIKAQQNSEFHRMRWGDTGSTRQLIVLKPKLVFNQLLPAKQSMQALQEISQTLKLDAAHGINIRMTGTIALQSDELKLLASSMPLSGLIALVLVSMVLFFAMRHPTLIFGSVITLLAGLIITGAFAAFSVGKLNLVSVAFAILFIGLGVDFAIHFCLRYKELRVKNIAHMTALRATGGDVGASLLLCAITTSAGFFAFIPTSFKGVSELGVISGGGILISLVTTLTLLPALLSISPIKSPALYERAKKFSRATGLFSERFISDPNTSKRLLVGFSIVLVTSVFSLPYVSFDNDPINLRSPESDSVSAYLDLLNDSDTSPLSLSSISQDLDELRDLQARLSTLATVARVVSLDQFIPAHQTEKLDLFADLDLILGGQINKAKLNQETPEQQIYALNNFIAQISVHQQGHDNETLKDLKQTLSDFLARLQQQNQHKKSIELQKLTDNLLGDLLSQIHRIRAGLLSQGVQAEALPPELITRWKSDSGYYKLQVLPAQDMTDNAKAAQFVRSVTSVAPNATGAPMINLEGGSAIVQSFQQAFASAFVLIFILLLFLLRKLSDAILVLTPLLLTAPLVVAVTVLLDTSFNYARIITLPLLLGISVDNGVHMVHRARHALPGHDHLLASSTGRAVVFSAATTVVSFGNLAFSPHIGTASMGLLLSIGMVCSLFCTLLLLPILIKRFIKT